MRKQILQIFTFLSAFFCVAAVAGFYPVNHGMINQSTSITNSFGVTSFVATQNQAYIHTGASGVWQIDRLGAATHLPIDWWYDIVNNSSSYVTVQDNGGNNIASVNAGEIGHFWSKGNGNDNGSWVFNVQASKATIAQLIPALPLSQANGGTGQTTQAAAFNALAPTSTKGDLIINNGSGNVAFPVCLNTQQMVADSTQATGWKCIASAAGAGAASVSAALPLLYNNSTFVMSLPQSATAADGYLGQTDWNTFNGKQAALGFTPLNKASNFSDIASAAAARTNLGLGVLATQNSVSIAAFSASPSAPGLTYSNNNLNMDPADATHPGGTSILAQSYAGKKTFTNGLDAGSNQITSVSDPTTAQMAATKSYVDTQLAQLNPAAAVVAASTANIPGTYTNTVGGVCIGDTFRVTATTAFAPDGVTLTLGQRFLMKDQSSSFQDGVWTLTTAANVGVLGALLTRATDSDSAADFNAGQIVPVSGGTVNTGSSWYQTAAISTCNSDSQTWTNFQKSSSAYLQSVNNLADVANAASAFNNISGMTAAGDIIVGGAAGVRSKVILGATGNVLTVATNNTVLWATASSSGPRSTVWVQSANGYGSTNIVIYKFSNVILNTGSDITYTSSSTNGDSFTINTTGVYSISYVQTQTSNSWVGISVNSSQLTTDVELITVSTRPIMVECTADASSGCMAFLSDTQIFTAGDVIRPHGAETTTAANAARANFIITKVSN